MLLFSIAYKVSAKKVQKNYLSWHWKKIQTLKKNWLFVWKMTWENWWTLIRAVESVKTCTLMGYFCRKYVMFERKNTEELCCEKWLIYGFKNDIRNLVNFPKFKCFKNNMQSQYSLLPQILTFTSLRLMVLIKFVISFYFRVFFWRIIAYGIKFLKWLYLISSQAT